MIRIRNKKKKLKKKIETKPEPKKKKKSSVRRSNDYFANLKEGREMIPIEPKPSRVWIVNFPETETAKLIVTPVHVQIEEVVRFVKELPSVKIKNVPYFITTMENGEMEIEAILYKHSTDRRGLDQDGLLHHNKKECLPVFGKCNVKTWWNAKLDAWEDTDKAKKRLEKQMKKRKKRKKSKR